MELRQTFPTRASPEDRRPEPRVCTRETSTTSGGQVWVAMRGTV